MRQITIITPGGIFAATKLATTLDTSFDLVLYLPIERAEPTARIVAGHTSGIPHEIPEPRGLNTSLNGRTFDAVRRKHGDAPLSVYFQDGYENAVKGVGYRYYRDIAQAIDVAEARYTLIVMDHILVPTVSMILANHIPEERFVQRALRPCEGYRLTMRNDEAERFSLEDIELYYH